MISVAVGLIRMDLKLRAKYLGGSFDFIPIAKDGANTGEVTHGMKLGPAVDAGPTLADLLLKPLAVLYALVQQTRIEGCLTEQVFD
ncbi:MAG: hypothetical protein QOH36_1285 [Actinomycetota bacterium]|nr:hypothetical protein [Actinomycetota bacterium]